MIHLRFLAYVDLLGTTYSASTIATGYGAYIALPLLRKAVEGRENTLTEEEARAIMEESLRVLFYRDARSLNKVRSGHCLLCMPLNTRPYYTVSNRHCHRFRHFHLGLHQVGDLLGLCRGHQRLWLSNAVILMNLVDTLPDFRCNENCMIMELNSMRCGVTVWASETLTIASL